MNLTLPKNSITLVYVVYNPKVDKTVPASSTVDKEVSSGAGTIKYLKDRAGITIEKSVGSGKTYMSTFNLEYYKADQGGDTYEDTDNVPSGAYVFKPK